jgi:hypothetical protein
MTSLFLLSESYELAGLMARALLFLAQPGALFALLVLFLNFQECLQ